MIMRAMFSAFTYAMGAAGGDKYNTLSSQPRGILCTQYYYNDNNNVVVVVSRDRRGPLRRRRGVVALWPKCLQKRLLRRPGQVSCR